MCMKKYFETKINYNQISFFLTNKPDIDEREIHSYHEILLFISGDGELLTGSGQMALKKHSVFVFPSETYHFFRLKSPEDFTRLKISFPSDLFKEIKFCDLRVLDNMSGNIGYLFDSIYNAVKNDSEKSGFYAYSALLMLLSELDRVDVELNSTAYTENSKLTRDVADYVSENLDEDLNIDSLSKKFHASPSGIVHMFKKEFGISVHKYITQKRLVRATQLIREGKQPSKIYSEVGFRDYSSFYKAYVKLYGCPPSKY